MVEIAILGFGTVGSGVFQVLETKKDSVSKRAMQPIQVKYVLDIRSLPGSPVEFLLIKDFNTILHDPEVKIVVEVMGGIEPAYTYVKQCLLNGKSVVTSNKELVAKHGAELLQIAKEGNLNFLFEASVGGAIPIIRSLNLSLTADEIFEISAILNGTTNYILTKMTNEGLCYEEVLKEAIRLGYAERNPDADVLGHDACRKLAILLSLVTGKQVNYEEILTEGITSVTQRDIAYAKSLGGAVKLLALAKKPEGCDCFFARVAPSILLSDSKLFHVNDVFNSILLKGSVIDEIALMGRGAGQLPTASAVVADVIDQVKHIGKNIICHWSTERLSLLPIEESLVQKLIRVQLAPGLCDFTALKAQINQIFGEPRFLQLYEDELAFVTPLCSEGDIDQKIKALGHDVQVNGCIRLG